VFYTVDTPQREAKEMLSPLHLNTLHLPVLAVSSLVGVLQILQTVSRLDLTQNHCETLHVEIPEIGNIFGLANSLGAVLYTIHVLGKLRRLRGNGITFSVRGLGYGSIIPGLVKPRDNFVCHNNKTVEIDAVTLFIGCCPSTRRFVIPRKAESFQTSHRVFDKFFQISKLAVPPIPAGTLGLHFRGTDRIESGIAAPLTQAEYGILLKDFLTRHHYSTFYIASDVAQFVDMIYAEFPEKELISLNQWRASNRSRTGIHFRKPKNVTIDTMARAALADLVALSRCRTIFKTASSFSAFAKVLNPSVRLLTVTANRVYPLFPEGVSSNEYSDPNMSDEAARILRKAMPKPDGIAVRLDPSALCKSTSCAFLAGE